MKERTDEQRAADDGTEASAEDPQNRDGRAEGAADGSGPDGERASESSREAELSQELETVRDRYLRLAAEYDNFRKRTERERAEQWVRAQAQLVEKLLDPLDDLQRVAHFTTDATSVESLLEGVQMVERKLLRVLEAAGLQMIDAHGQSFNPEEHEALMTAPTAEQAEDETVGEVFQKGYRFQGDLLRPARVQVRKHQD